MGRPRKLASTEDGDEATSNYERWDNEAVSFLLEYLEKDGNYAKWRCSGEKQKNGATKTNGQTKTQIVNEISLYLATKGCQKDALKVKNKIKQLEDKYRKTADWLSQTGEGI